MIFKSLKRTWLTVSAVTIIVVLAIIAFVSVYLFQKGLESRFQEELTSYVNQIADNVNIDKYDKLHSPKNLSDQRFELLDSGLYWQIDDPVMNVQLLSQSLGEFVIPLPIDEHDAGAVHRYNLPGPDNSIIVVQERSLVVAAPSGARTIRVAVALDEAYIRESSLKFLGEMFAYLLALGAVLLAASYLQYYLSVRPLKRLSESMEAVLNRDSQRLQGEFPVEIKPLFNAVNGLLSSQEAALNGARARSADIAHSLKTPLTVIRNNAAKLIEKGDAEIGREIGLLANDMRYHIERELARSRLAPSAAMRQSDADVAVIVDNIVRTLKKVSSAEQIEWHVEVPGPCLIGMDPHDLQELLGNLLENASKWASNCVNVSAKVQANVYYLWIEDDGPGLDTEKIKSMTLRGQRHDEIRSGTGVGLAIVQDIVDLYSLKMSIQNRQSNGLRINLELPMPDTDVPKIPADYSEEITDRRRLLDI